MKPLALYKTTRYVHMVDTDMTGAIYFTAMQKYALMCFEEYLFEKKIALFERGLALPIVHVEADYNQPFSFGEKISIELDLLQIGNSSFTTQSTLTREVRSNNNSKVHELGKVCVTHVLLDSNKKEKILFTDDLKNELFVAV